jgi:hypothetical protein
MLKIEDSRIAGLLAPHVDRSDPAIDFANERSAI